MVVPIDKGVGNPKTLRKATSSPSANNKIKRFLLLTKRVHGTKWLLSSDHVSSLLNFYWGLVLQEVEKFRTCTLLAL